LSVDVCEPRVGFEAGPVEAPPFAELGPAERETVDLAEVDPVSLIDESRDVFGVVERAAAYEKVSQSGWPDSNRRLLRPKRSTLTRLSYTPRMEISVDGWLAINGGNSRGWRSQKNRGRHISQARIDVAAMWESVTVATFIARKRLRYANKSLRYPQ
jgi:hypothetical protein